MWGLYLMTAAGAQILEDAAQAQGVDIFTELWKAAKEMTPPAVLMLLAALYYIDRMNKSLQVKNDALQTKREELFEKVMQLANETNTTLKEFREMFTKLVRIRRDQKDDSLD